MKKIILLILLIFLVFVSGCIELPWFNGKDEYKDDVIIISSITAPQTIKVGQTASIRTFVKNIGKKKIDNVIVNLYDYNPGLIKEVENSCEKKKKEDDIETECEISLRAGETKSIEWRLTPEDIGKLPTDANLKFSVKYAFNTSGLNTVHFITESEYQKQGTVTKKSSKPTLGEGPIKAYFEVQDPEPIRVEDKAKVNLKLIIENKGRGFLEENLTLKNINLAGLEPTENCAPEIKEFLKKGEPLDVEKRLIKGKASLSCSIEGTLPDLEKELTKKLQVDISYWYRFNYENMKIKINPM